MGFARALRREITATDYLPFLRHADEHTIITTGRGAFQMLKIEGASFRTADTSGINALHDGLNHHIRNVADDNVMIYSAHHSQRRSELSRRGVLRPNFGHWLDAAYKTQIQQKRLFRNDLYLTIYLQPRGLAGSWFANGIRRARNSQVEADQDLLDQLGDKASLAGEKPGALRRAAARPRQKRTRGLVPVPNR